MPHPVGWTVSAVSVSAADGSQYRLAEEVEKALYRLARQRHQSGKEEEEEEEERFIFPTTTTLVHTLNKFIKLKFYTWLEKKR